MIPTIQLTENLLVSGQPALEDLRDLSAQGVTTVICNRPDGEGEGQPTMDDVEAVLAEQGIALVRYPVNPATFPGEDLSLMANALDSGSGKVYAFCRTGTRTANLWVLAQPAAEQAAALQTARDAGFDMSLAERQMG